MRIYRNALVAVCGLAALSASTLNAQTWSATSTQGISLSQLVSAVDLGPVPVSQPLTVRVGLAVQNKAALLSFVQAVSDPANAKFGQFLTPAQFAASYAPSSAQVAKVTSYLTSAGFTNVVVEPNNLLISADGTAQAASAAFNTPLRQYSQGGARVFANTSAAQVPAALKGVVSAVLGLNSIGKMATTLKKQAPSLPQYGVSYTPQQFWTIYDANTIWAANVSIAIMAEGDLTGVLSDLRIAEKAFGVRQVPVQVVQVGIASPDTSGADEWDLDSQYSSSMAGNLKELYMYTTTSLSDSDLALEFSRWVTDDKAKAASASLGECEAFPFLDGSMVVDDMTFLQAAAQGQTFFASAGDTGSFCPVSVAGVNGVPAGAPLVNYPASSPYVVGVGGTTLLANADYSYNTEISWYAGGGGLSQFEAPGYWQKGVSPLIAQTGDRGVPDVAFDADPETGATVYVAGVPEGIGGTSLSSPAWLGIWARAVATNPKLGFASPALYSLYTPGTEGLPGTYPKTSFHDVTVGVNGFYPTTAGYDLNTGLGTPIVCPLTQALKYY